MTQAAALSPEYVLLGFLNQQPAHGYDLHEHIEAKLGQIWHISLSQTYNILNRLETQGYIAGAVQEQEKLPVRKRFRLTAAGRRRFEDWLSTATSLARTPSAWSSSRACILPARFRPPPRAR